MGAHGGGGGGAAGRDRRYMMDKLKIWLTHYSKLHPSAPGIIFRTLHIPRTHATEIT